MHKSFVKFKLVEAEGILTVNLINFPLTFMALSTKASISRLRTKNTISLKTVGWYRDVVRKAQKTLLYLKALITFFRKKSVF